MLAFPLNVARPKKKPRPERPGMSRGRRGVFLRIPPPLYEKLQRMTAVAIAGGERGTIQGTVMKLIEQAREKSL